MISLRIFAFLTVLALFGLADTTRLHSGDAVPRRLAICIAVPSNDSWGDAAGNDMHILHQALHARGFHATQILTLTGNLSRTQILDFLRESRRRIAGWPDGQLVLYYSGSGHFPPGKTSAKGDETGWELHEMGSFVLWNDIFNSLDVPRGVKVLLFPDCCYTNTLQPGASNNRAPANYYGMVLEGKGDDIECKAGNGAFNVNGQRKLHGILTFYATQALRNSDTVEEWVNKTMTLYNHGRANELFPNLVYGR